MAKAKSEREVQLTILTPSGASDLDWRSRFDVLQQCLRSVGVAVEGAPWTALEDLTTPAAALLVWDYHHYAEEWLSRIEKTRAKLLNGADVLRWNTDKLYLKDLARFVPVVPTMFEDNFAPERARAVAQMFGCEELVLKPHFGASSAGVQRVRYDQPFDPPPGPVLVQPFLRRVVDDGEISLLYFGGVFSHATLKAPARDEYRVQAEFGGSVHKLSATEEMLQLGAQALTALAEAPDYARVDMLRDNQGVLRIAELELIEPELFLEFADDGGSAFAATVRDRLLRVAGR